jgi:GH24 family phage-related lysozyme (muramidase)
MANSYRLSSLGYKDLLATEGNMLFVYDDKTGKAVSSYESAVGYPTIGLGLLIDSAEKRERFRPYLNGVSAPASVIESANREFIAKFEKALNAQLDNVQLTASMFDALFSLGWNTGTASKWVKEVVYYAAAKNYAAAAAAIANGPVTSKGQVIAGLVKRRAAEAVRFLADGLPGGARAVAAAVPALLFAVMVGGGTWWFLKRRKRRR